MASIYDIKYGDVVYPPSGTLVHLTEDAYADSDCDNYLYYTAEGVDDSGNEYLVRWEPVLKWAEIAEAEDEGSACNWDEYTVTLC